MPIPGPRCPYCEGNPPSRLGDASEVYGPAWKDRFPVWLCVNYPDCDAYVGVHRESHNASPLGSLARKPLRDLRIRVHNEFDKLWKPPDGKMTRKAAYEKLSELMQLPSGKAHVSWFTEEECERALAGLWRMVNHT